MSIDDTGIFTSRRQIEVGHFVLDVLTIREAGFGVKLTIPRLVGHTRLRAIDFPTEVEL